MAKKASAKLNSAGIVATMKSAGVRADVRARAERIAAAAGPGHQVRVAEGRTRVRATVTTATRAAKKSEAKNKTLTRAIDAGRR